MDVLPECLSSVTFREDAALVSVSDGLVSTSPALHITSSLLFRRFLLFHCDFLLVPIALQSLGTGLSSQPDTALVSSRMCSI